MAEKKYSIGSVSRRLSLPQSVLRYWESVFDNLNPEKTPGGTREYSEDDIILISKIKNLLYDRKFTIAGAREFFKDQSFTLRETDRQLCQDIVREIEDLLRILEP